MLEDLILTAIGEAQKRSSEKMSEAYAKLTAASACRSDPRVCVYRSKYLELLIEELVKLPSIGQKSAQRLALHLLRVPKEDAVRLAEAIRAVRERVRILLDRAATSASPTRARSAPMRAATAR